MKIQAISALTLATVLMSCLRIGQDACDHDPSIPGCGPETGGGPVCKTDVIGGPIWECNVTGGPNTVPIPVPCHDHGGMCGSFYLAPSLVDAEDQTGVAGNPQLSCVAAFGMAIPWTSCIAANDTDGGSPCSDLDGPCATTAAGPKCCADSLFMPGSRLVCDSDYTVSDTGTCCIEEGYACSDNTQCCTEGGVVDTCHLGVCCSVSGAECFVGPSSENPVTDNDGCCLDTKCLPDAIGNGLSCQ